MNKRDEKTMLQLILEVAKQHDDIQIVIMNGSRSSPGAKKDAMQDYDIIYVVNHVEPYVQNQQWLNPFGERLIMQTPEEMDGIWPKSKDLFDFLMLFTDGNRIDLRLISYNKFISMPRDSQSTLLLDKNLKAGQFEHPSDKDYLPRPPTEKQFNDCCNEFLWVSTNVAKGIFRKQLPYVKYSSEQIVKEQLIKLLEWYAAIKTHFQQSIGAHAKYLEQYLDPEIWARFCQTYVNANYENIWNGLFLMHEIFNEIALKVSSYYEYKYNPEESKKIINYLHSIRDQCGLM